LKVNLDMRVWFKNNLELLQWQKWCVID